MTARLLSRRFYNPGPMSLITGCPACGTMFKVVPDQLKISDGWVRCGHCSRGVRRRRQPARAGRRCRGSRTPPAASMTATAPAHVRSARRRCRRPPRPAEPPAPGRRRRTADLGRCPRSTRPMRSKCARPTRRPSSTPRSIAAAAAGPTRSSPLRHVSRRTSCVRRWSPRGPGSNSLDDDDATLAASTTRRSTTSRSCAPARRQAFWRRPRLRVLLAARLRWCWRRCWRCRWPCRSATGSPRRSPQLAPCAAALCEPLRLHDRAAAAASTPS